MVESDMKFELQHIEDNLKDAVETLKRKITEEHFHSPLGFPTIDVEVVLTAMQEIECAIDDVSRLKEYFKEKEKGK